MTTMTSSWFFATPLKRAVTIYLMVITTLVCCAVLLQPIIFPLLFSLVLYILLSPIISQLMGRGLSRSRAIAITLGLLIVTLTGTMMVIAPLIAEQLSEFQQRIPALWKTTSQQLNQLAIWLSDKLGAAIDLKSMLNNMISNVEGYASSAIIGSASLMIQFATGLILMPIIAFFMLRDLRTFRNRLMSLLPNKGFELGWLIYFRVTRQLQQYLRGIAIQSLIIAVIATIGFTIIGLEMAALFGILTGLLNLIPYIGPLLAMLPPLFLSMGGGSIDPYLIGGIVTVILAVQLIDNLVIVPSLIANTVNLHPLTTILGIIIFGSFFGFIGMLVAIPIMATSKIIFVSLLLGLSGKSGSN